MRSSWEAALVFVPAAPATSRTADRGLARGYTAAYLYIRSFANSVLP
jgi:hypothetical protein